MRPKLLVAGGLGQLVHQVRRGRVADAATGLRDRGAQPDQQVGLAGAGIADQAERVAGLDPGGLGEGADDLGRDVGVLREVEVLGALVAREARLFDPAELAPLVAVLALALQKLGQEVCAGRVLAQGLGGELLPAAADR